MKSIAMVAAVIAFLATAILAPPADAATAWTARIGSSYGDAKIIIGTSMRLSIAAKNFRARTTYTVSLRRGGCSALGTLILSRRMTTSSYGKIIQSFALTTTQARLVRLPLSIRVGTRCGTFKAPVAPTPTPPPATPAITEFVVPTASSAPFEMATGPDGNVWFTEMLGNKIGRITPSGTISEFPLPIADSRPWGIAAGPDGNLWFGENGDSARGIGRITSGGVITQFEVVAMNRGPCPLGCPICVPPTNMSKPAHVTPGPDGAMWFSDPNVDAIGRMTTDGTYIEFKVSGGVVLGLTTGSDGNIWFVDYVENKIGRLTLQGVFTMFPVPAPGYGPQQITAGPDGALWFTQVACISGSCAGSQIGRIDTSGNIVMFPLPNAWSMPADIVAAPDGNLWFTESWANKIGRITPSGTITEFAIPTANSGPAGLTVGPDGNIWFAEASANKIGRLVISLAP